MQTGWPQWYYLWPLFLPVYDKKDLRRRELEEHLSHIELRPMTCMDLEAICKRLGDKIELCRRGITQSLGVGKKVHKMP